MSWDLFVQDIPTNIQSVRDIPDDFRPAPVGTRSEIIQMIQEVVPRADFTEPAWGRIEEASYSIEINLGDKEEVQSFAFHVRGEDEAAFVIAAILDHLQLRAFDPQAESGLFDIGSRALEGLRKWRTYRDRVIKSGS